MLVGEPKMKVDVIISLVRCGGGGLMRTWLPGGQNDTNSDL